MKNSKKIVKTLCFLAVTLLCINCQKGIISEHLEETSFVEKQALFSSRIIHNNEIESNRLLSDKLRTLSQLRTEDTSAFTVDTETAKYVEKADGSVYSYTFTVNRDGSPNTHVENLVISVNNQTQEITTVLVKYLFTTAQYQEVISTSGHVSTSFDTEIIELDEDFSHLIPEVDMAQPCTFVETTYHITPSPDLNIFVYGSGSICHHIDPDTGETECEVYSTLVLNCPDTPASGSAGSGTTTEPYDPNNTTNGGSNASGNTQSNDDSEPNNEIITSITGKFETDCEIANNLSINCDALLEFEQDYRGQMSQSELQIFDGLSRYKQLTYLGNAYEALTSTQALFPGNEQYNGKGDAFRHAYWNALNVRSLGLSLTESLTTAHENRPAPLNYPNYYKEKQMDLFNNQVGRDVYLNLSITSPFSIQYYVLEALNNGSLRYLNNLDPNTNRATNASQLIPTNQ